MFKQQMFTMIQGKGFKAVFLISMICALVFFFYGNSGAEW